VAAGGASCVATRAKVACHLLQTTRTVSAGPLANLEGWQAARGLQSGWLADSARGRRQRAVARSASDKTLTFPPVEPACPDRISHPVTRATRPACLQRDVCCQRGPLDAVARHNAPGRRRKMYQALAAASVSSRSFHLQEAPFGGPPPTTTISTGCQADASSTSSDLLSGLLRPMRNEGPTSSAVSSNPCSPRRGPT
jgi:hypothetical protein